MEHATPIKSSTAVVQKQPTFFAPAFVQPKLTIGPIDDPYEREADTMADKVMRMTGEQDLQTKPSAMNVQRKCTHCEEEENKLQRKPGDSIQQRDADTAWSDSAAGKQTDPYLHVSITVPPPKKNDDDKINYADANLQLIEQGVNTPADYIVDYSNLWKADYQLSKGLRLGTMIKNLYGMGEKFDAQALKPVRRAVKKIPLVGNFLKDAIKLKSPKVEGGDWDKYVTDKMALSALRSDISHDHPEYNKVSGLTFTVNIIDTHFEENNIGKLFRKPGPGSDDSMLQRKCTSCQEDEKLHRKESAAAGNTLSTNSVTHTLQSDGEPMDKATQSFMEERFGYDFSKVKIHNNSLAHQSSADINALAYTHKNHIVFGAGNYQPHTDSGKKLLAHELTHVVQQRGRDINRKNKPAPNNSVQRAYTFGPKPRPGGENIHKLVLPAFVAKGTNADLFVEVSIPGANKEDVDTGLVGVADMYIPDPTNGKQRTIGVKFENDEPKNLKRNNRFQYGGGDYDHNTESAPKGHNSPPKVRRLDNAPTKILLGDLKPGGHSEPFFTAQLTNYKDGILKTSKALNQYLASNPSQSDSKTLSWNIMPENIQPITKDLHIPESLKYGVGKGIFPTKELAVYDGRTLRANAVRNLRGAMYVYKNQDQEGIWSYEWIPDKAEKQVQSDSAKEVLNRLNSDIIPTLSRKPKPNPKPKEQPPRFNYDDWDKNIFTPWQNDAQTVLQDKGFIEQGALAQALMQLQDRIPDGKFHAEKDTADIAKANKKIELWHHQGRNFGRIRRFFGPFYNKTVSFLGKTASKIKGFLGGGNKEDEEVEGSGIIKKVAATAFLIVKKFAVIIFQRVAEGMKDSLVRGVKNILKELFTAALGEQFLSTVNEIEGVIQKIENFEESVFLKPFENWIERALKIIDLINEIKNFLSQVADIESKVKWVIRAIQCVSPPAVGCLKLFFTFITEKLIERAVNSCTFQGEVYLPIFNKLNFLRSLPGKIIEGLIEIGNKIIPLPSFIHQPLFAAPPHIDSIMEKDDLPCNNDERINKINLAFARLEGKYSKEKVQLLLEVLKKRGVGEETELDMPAVERLDAALHELEGVNDATLMSMEDAPTDTQTPIMALEEFIQSVKDTDKRVFELDDAGGADLKHWYFVGHLPIEKDGRIRITVSAAQPCKDWHPLILIKIKARQKTTEQLKGGKPRKIYFEALETIDFKLGGDKEIKTGTIFWAFSPDPCDKLGASRKLPVQRK